MSASVPPTTAASDAPSVTPTTITPSARFKPGWQTTEFWLSSGAKLLGILFASGVLGDGTVAMRIAGIAAALRASLGYTISRGMVKAAGVMILVLAISATSPACATLRPRGATAAGAFLDCEDAGLKALWTGLLGLARTAILSVIDPTTGKADPAKLQAALTDVKDDAPRCAINAVVAGIVTPPLGLAARPGVDVGQLQAAYATARSELGWPRMEAP